LIVGIHDSNGDFVSFPLPYDVGKPIGSVKKAHGSVAEKAEIKGHFRLYDLRHTFATRAADGGTDLATLSARVGHASLLMTMRYVYPAAEPKRLAIEKFRSAGIIAAAMAKRSQGVPTKGTTVERVQ